MILSFHLASFGFILAIALAVATSPASAVKCGDKITKKTVLTADLSCGYRNGSPALEMVGPATLDLNGHTVLCTQSSADGSIRQVYDGISVRGKGVTIKNGKITKCERGIAGFELDGALIKDIIATGSGDYGIYVEGNNSRIQNVTAKDSYYEYYGDGIFVSGSNNRLLHVTVTNITDYSIIVNGDNNQVKDSYVARSELTGILLSGNNNAIISNSVQNIGYSCIGTYGRDVGNVFRNNTVRRCGGFGVFFSSNNTIIADNKIDSTEYSGIDGRIWYGTDRITGTRITGNRITKSKADGIKLDGVQDAVVADNVIVDSAENAILLKQQSARCRIKSNTIRNCGMVGLRITGADGNNVTDNKISFCKTGMSAGLGSNDNRLINNRASYNTGFDLVDFSPDCGSNVWKGNTGKGNIGCTQKN